jgi:hypothetical protein
MAPCRALPAVTLLLSSVVAGAHADDLWFQPVTPLASGSTPPVPGSLSSGSAPAAAGPADYSKPATEYPPGYTTVIVLGVPMAPPTLPSVEAVPEQNTPPPPPVRLPRLTFDLGAGAAMANTDNPPAGLSIDLLGGNPSRAMPVTLDGDFPYSTSVDVRSPAHQLGLHAVYILSPQPTVGAPLISVGASFGVNTYNQTETDREGVATFRIDF